MAASMARRNQVKMAESLYPHTHCKCYNCSISFNDFLVFMRAIDFVVLARAIFETSDFDGVLCSIQDVYVGFLIFLAFIFVAPHYKFGMVALAVSFN